MDIPNLPGYKPTQNVDVRVTSLSTSPKRHSSVRIKTNYPKTSNSTTIKLARFLTGQWKELWKRKIQNYRKHFDSRKTIMINSKIFLMVNDCLKRTPLK